MKRFNQIILILAFLGFSWLAMQMVHELGHVLAATVSGGKVSKVVLHPCVISRTDIAFNPHPLFVSWAGPIVGIIFPLMVFLVALALKFPGVYLFRFFAGFCLIANGAYIGAGSFQRLGDAGDMLRHGSTAWQLILFGLLTIPLGLYLWNGLGPSFGLGKANGNVSRRATIISLILFAIIAGLEIII